MKEEGVEDKRVVMSLRLAWVEQKFQASLCQEWDTISRGKILKKLEGSCINYFSLCCGKIRDKGNLKEEGAFLAYDLR